MRKILTIRNFIFGLYFVISAVITLLSAFDLFFGTEFGYSSEDLYWGLGFIAFGIVLYVLTGFVHLFMFRE